MNTPTRALLTVMALTAAACSFEPNVPSARVLCSVGRDCPSGFTCEAVPAATTPGVSVCCRQPGCARGLNADDIRRISVAAARPDGGGPAGACGNRKLDTGETCDPPGDCPTSCPAIGCTRRKLEGSAATCTARCVDDDQQSACQSGDSCCPPGCTEATDKDCACVCGNGVKEDACGESCDPRETCPTSCAPQGCNLRRVVNPGTCQAACVDEGTQTACLNGDGCCPDRDGCSAANDDDCRAACGNGALEPGERCDPKETCPTRCPPLGCTLQRLEGSADACTARCVDDGTQKTCVSGDRCCPPGCTAASDTDCACVCGNGVKEEACGETCDPKESCPTACPPQGCQLRRLVNAGSCQAVCVPDGEQTTCLGGDGCCPPGCNANNDGDCTARCGNGVKEGDEQCDPASSCPGSCPWMGCNRRKLEGEASRCSARCVGDGLQTECAHGDGCCPPACNAGNDNDCQARCGNGVREGQELCDGDCPQSCPPTGCQRRRLEGDPTRCDVRCVDDSVITMCASGDGCCASGCTSLNDQDCQCQCGNGVTEIACGEKCEGGSCPASCPPQGCDLFRLQGTAAACTAECVRTGSQTMCKNGDGCCPAGCNARNDDDCRPVCGNSVVEAGEQCDPKSACQDAFDACINDDNNIRMRTGRVDDCTFRCVARMRGCSAAMDGFCPTLCRPCLGACGPMQDLDCRLNDGALCSHPNQCNGSCTDGRCCTQTCAACQSCTGARGTCVAIPALQKDNVPAGACTGARSCNGSVAGAAACKLDDLQPCTGDDQCASGVCTTFFSDGDGDGQVGSTGTRVCGTTAPPGTQAAPGPDCCDSDPRVKREDMPLALFETANACGHFDYDCANGEQLEANVTQLCDLVLCRSGWAPNAPIPACGQTADYGECVRRNFAGTTFCDQHPTKPRAQRCR